MYSLSALILEDHPVQRLIAVQLLETLTVGPILQAPEGTQALKQLNEHGAVDVLLCDIQMPGMDGLGFLQAASKRGLVRSVIICSNITPDLRRAAAKMVDLIGLQLLGDSDKPLRPSKLETMLARFDSNRYPSDKMLTQQHPQPTPMEIQQALAQGQFEAHYQPKLDLNSGRPIGAEVLARWRHPERGLLGPQNFLPAMEKYGELDRLFESLLEQGLPLAAYLRANGTPLPLAFNLDAAQLSNPEFCLTVAKKLKFHHLPGSDVTIEVTESSILHSPATSLENMIRLRLMGCGVSVDDFGTGYSSLKRLCEMPCNELKIDASFVQAMTKSPQCRAAITSTLSFASTLNLNVVAEGIETVEQLELLKSFGCTRGQGFLLARPLERKQLLSWLN
ncbi:EAL domain-containing response regulator [Pseudomonas sp. GZD-222]|uniref:EAL domain-containing response regulator n=1 Tax=Pseudomonas sp. GZD-222 TaxID=3404805 RepID=UPI003BB69927